MNWFTETSWSPYVVGAGIGILSWCTWLVSNESIGTSQNHSVLRDCRERKELFAVVDHIYIWPFLFMGVVKFATNFGQESITRVVTGFAG